MPTELNQTGRLLLGLIAKGVVTGYDMKAKVDAATHFFWGASFGGIYPELARLEAGGLVEVREAPQGGRRRREYALTERGQAVYEDWLHDEDITFELRHEGLLKLFLTGGDPRVLRVAAAHHRRVLDQLAAIDAPDDLALRFGRDLNAWAAAWFDEAADRSDR